jgi:hypothetical protein
MPVQVKGNKVEFPFVDEIDQKRITEIRFDLRVSFIDEPPRNVKHIAKKMVELLSIGKILGKILPPDELLTVKNIEITYSENDNKTDELEDNSKPDKDIKQLKYLGNMLESYWAPPGIFHPLHVAPYRVTVNSSNDDNIEFPF